MKNLLKYKENKSENALETPNKAQVYALYDKKSNKFDTPFFCHSDLFAGRNYKMMMSGSPSIVNTFPEDFDLVKLGSFDRVSGDFHIDHKILITGIHKEDTK